MYRLDSGAGSLNCTVPGHTEFVETVEAMSSRGSCPVSDGIRDQAYLSIIALINNHLWRIIKQSENRIVSLWA